MFQLLEENGLGIAAILVKSLVHYKRKFTTGIISSWENYIKDVVSNYIQFVYIQFVLVILYYYVTFFYNLFTTKLHIYNLQGSKCLWIHHWVVLQFLHKHFVVGRNTDLSVQIKTTDVFTTSNMTIGAK